MQQLMADLVVERLTGIALVRVPAPARPRRSSSAPYQPVPRPVPTPVGELL